MDAGLQSQSTSLATGKGRRMRGLQLTLMLIGVVIGAAIAALYLSAGAGRLAAFCVGHSSPRSASCPLDCDDRRAHPEAITQAAAENQTSNHATPSPFICPKPTPCSVRASFGHRRKEEGGHDWDLSVIPLANRTLNVPTPRRSGFCDPKVSQRAFQASGIDYESLVNFEPCQLFNLIQGRTLWIFGDSQLLSLHRSLLAFMAEFSKNPQDVLKEVPTGIPTVDLLLKHPIHPANSGPLCNDMINDTRICYVRLLRITFKELQYALEILARAIPEFRHHVVLFNVGLHYGSPPYRPKMKRDLQVLVDYRKHVLSTLGEDNLPRMLWIDTPPQHFNLPRGEYNLSKNLTADMCAPFDEAQIAQGNRGWFNAIAAEFIGNVSDAHVQTWKVAERNHFSHLKIGDCTHYCRPGVPELWIYVLTTTLAKVRSPCG